MKKEILLRRFTYFREYVFLGAVGIALLFTLNKPSQTIKVNRPPIVVTEKVTVKEPVKLLSDDDFSKLYTLRSDVKNDTCLELSQEDATLLMEIARTEGGDSYIGQLWVMRLIINRLNDGCFGDSIYEIISADKQFEVYSSGAYLKAELNENSHLALAALEGGWDETEGALYFEASSNSENSWHKRSRTFIKTVEGNLFYK